VGFWPLLLLLVALPTPIAIAIELWLETRRKRRAAIESTAKVLARQGLELQRVERNRLRLPVRCFWYATDGRLADLRFEPWRRDSLLAGAVVRRWSTPLARLRKVER
jgi:hypothetical protein